MAQPRHGERAAKPPREALRHRLRVRIAAACSQRQLTPREFADLVNKPARQVTNHFRALETAGWLRRVREGVNRGVHTHPFTAERQAVVGDKEFAQMSAK